MLSKRSDNLSKALNAITRNNSKTNGDAILDGILLVVLLDEHTVKIRDSAPPADRPSRR